MLFQLHPCLLHCQGNPSLAHSMATKKTESPTTALPVPLQMIERRIYFIRGNKVMLDSDLAELYQVPTKRFNEA